jgi:hypothetical protein
MRLVRCLLLACLVAPFALANPIGAPKQTVCTITVNSADEKEAFRRYLPRDRYDFVELVERDRPDWLSAACRRGVRCDVLVVSGHYDGGNEFFSDQVAAREYLPVAELERVSCSDSCPGLFSRLKEVYLFGCNTLNPEALRTASDEVTRSLVRGGYSREDALRVTRSLNERHGQSSRDRMRLIFNDVPEIYGFSSVAPVGPLAGSTLSRYFASAGTSEVGQGHPHSRLLAQFSAFGLTMTRGMTASDPQAAYRRDVCHFADDRLSAADKARFVHQLLQRPMGEVRMFLDRIEAFAAALEPAERRDTALVQALAAIARDDAVRSRYLAFARDADQPAIAARMFDLAERFGWLTEREHADEFIAMLSRLSARRAIGPAEVDLACAANRGGALDGAYARLDPPNGPVDLPTAALRACLGSGEDRPRVLDALASVRDADVRIAQAYVGQRPLSGVEEVRKVTLAITQMREPEAQARALQALGRYQLSDPESLEALTRLYPEAPSWALQVAIADVLIRADYESIAKPDFVRALREHRRRSPHGADVIDALIRRLEQH